MKVPLSDFIQSMYQALSKCLKFGLYEKHTKFEKNLPHGFDKSAVACNHNI